MKEKLAWSLLFGVGGCLVLVAAYRLHALNSGSSAAAAAVQSSEALGSREDPDGQNAGANRRRERPFVTMFRATPAPRPGEPQNAAPAAAPEATPEALQPTPTPEVTTTVALAALVLVGTDQQATQIWISAINDPARPALERQNLILGLPILGFADPTNLTADELTLVQTRMALIEAIAPGTIDDSNRTAFQSAYASLQTMESQLTGQ